MNTIAKIRAEIERLKKVHNECTFPEDDYTAGGFNGYHLALDRVLSFLYILEKEQPSLPSVLDEAAEAFIEKRYNETHEVNLDDEVAFKAGAEWMAEQGEIHELTVESPVLGPPMICCPVHADNGDKVIVQIRKK